MSLPERFEMTVNGETAHYVRVRPKEETPAQRESELVRHARDEAPPPFEERRCKHNLLAKRIPGIAKIGKRAGQPYVMWVCPETRAKDCGYKVFCASG